MAANDLLVTIDASTEGLRRQLNAADAAVAKFDRTTKASLGQIDSTMRKVDQSFNALNKGATGFSRYGAAAQQAGYQVGDFFTQIASGSNPLVALTQQLGQLLGAFGTAGAVLGAGAAIAGTLAIKFVDTRSASEKFKDGLKGLEAQLEASNALLKETEGGLTAVADAFARADEFQQALIRSNLEESIRKGSDAIRDQAKAIKELTGAQELFGTISGPGGRPTTAIGVIRPAEGLSKDQAFGISEAMRAFEQSDGGLEAAKAFAQAIINLRAELNGASPAFTEFADQILVAVEESIKGGKSLEALRRQLATLGQDVPKGAEAFKALAKGIAEADEAAEKLRNTARGIVAAYNPMVTATRAAVDKLVALRDAFNADLISAEDYRAAVASIRAEHEKAKDPLAATLTALQAEADILKKSEDDRKRATRVQTEYTEAVKKGAPATEATRKAIEKEVDAIVAQEKANAAAKKTADAADQQRDKEKRDRETLSKQRTQTVEELQSEARYLADLVVAQGQGEEAVYRVERARKAELEVQRLKLENNPVEKKQIEDLVGVNEDHKRAIDKIKDAQKASEDAAKKALAEQKRAAEEATREYEKLIDSIANVSQEKLGDALFDALKGETLDFAEFLKDTLLRAIADIAAAALTRQIVIPIAAQVIGGAPGLFGLSGGAAQVAQQAAGSAGINPLSFLNFGGGGGIYNTFATSGLGSALGLSSAYAGLGGAFGVSAATAPAALALSGPLGGFGTAVGGATASTGGLVGAAGLGGATAPGLTGLGAGLGAALPYIGIALAGLSLFSGMFQGNPSVGPVGVADFSPGLGRRRAFDVPGIDPFTADNGGNGESLRPIAEAIADLIANSADRFSATINESLRFRVANYGGPEGGSGREAGFEVNAFIRGEAEKRIAEGLSQEQAVFEALKFAIQEAFTFDSATIAEAAANTAGTTTEEILADLDFAQNFERLGDALIELGGFVDANTLAQAQQTVALLAQAEAFAAQNAAPITDALEKARELFPASRGGQETVRQTIRGVVVPTDFDEGAARGSRFVAEGSEEFDRLVSEGARVISRVEEVTRAVTVSSENYAANMNRVALSVDIAKAGMDLLVDQITGDFEPAVRGPFQSALEQGRANLDALRVHMEDVNAEITAANAAFPGLSRALIDVAAALTDAEAALLTNLRDDFRQQVADALDPNAATSRAFVEAATPRFTDAVMLGVGEDRTLMRDLFEALGNGLEQTGLSVADMAQALADLETAAAQAGISVDGLADQALTNLRDAFDASIQSQLNAATGLGAINQINDLIATRTVNVEAATALGRDPNATAGALFDAQVRQALGGASLSDLGALLSSGQIVDAGAQAIVEAVLAEQALAAVREQEALAALDTAAALEDQIDGMRELAEQAERFADAANDNARTLRQAAQGLLVDPNLSPLSPQLRLEEARRQFEAAFGLANDNDPTDDPSQDAISRLPALSQTMLEASKAYYGSTEGYLADFNRAQSYLNDTALRQESIEQQQLTALHEIEAAITAAGGAVGSASQRAAASGFQFGARAADNMRIYDALVAAGLPTPSGFGAGQANALRASNPAVDALLDAMGFATGGSFTVAGPAGNDNLLMPLRLSAGEAVNVSRQDSMAAMASELRAARTQASETAAINKALLHEVTQLRVQNARWAQADLKSARRVADMQAAQPRRAYG